MCEMLSSFVPDAIHVRNTVYHECLICIFQDLEYVNEKYNKTNKQKVLRSWSQCRPDKADLNRRALIGILALLKQTKSALQTKKPIQSLDRDLSPVLKFQNGVKKRLLLTTRDKMLQYFRHRERLHAFM